MTCPLYDIDLKHSSSSAVRKVLVTYKSSDFLSLKSSNTLGLHASPKMPRWRESNQPASRHTNDVGELLNMGTSPALAEATAGLGLVLTEEAATAET